MTKRNRQLAHLSKVPNQKGSILTNAQTQVKSQPLVRVTSNRFKLSLSLSLHRDYCFKKLNKDELKKLDQFVSETVDKGLTITQVDTLFLRNKGPIKARETIKGVKREIIHYGKDRDSFRLHGFYDDNGYFVLYKIDPKHKVHKGH
ncbi:MULTISPECIES: MAG6450 family protein [Fructobacillus]|uniref:MAG6450 family protein n=1 Tax=Fructobacillus TaxID=559173 RepID=UPI0030C89183